MYPELTESRWIGCLTGSIWNTTNPNQICWHQEPTFWHSDQRKFLERWMESCSVFCPILWVSRCILVAISKVFLLRFRERIVIVAKSKRGQNTISNDGSPTADARPFNLVMHSLGNETTSSRSTGSLVYPVNEDERKRVGQAPGNWMLYGSLSEVGNSQVSRQEKVLQATRELGQKDQTQTKSEEKPSCTRKLDPSSPEFSNMEDTNHQYMSKIFQNLEMKLGMSAINATFSMNPYKANVLTWYCFWRRRWKPPSINGHWFLEEFGNLQEHKIREYLECLQNYSKVHRGTFLRNSECGMPGIFITPMDEIKNVPWQRDQVGEGNCVYADSVLCVGKVEQEPGVARAKWAGQMEDFKRYPSYRDAVGLDGEAIEFEWKHFPGFSTLTILQEIQND